MPTIARHLPFGLFRLWVNVAAPVAQIQFVRKQGSQTASAAPE
ncbi:hypothetical protein HYFRA_00012457 [Hymenoscyphus fraxineus]|uniref:Uncharacterized protein n=1 Tax=Hymenoscyphus fraxineus TaxID=746836 RepID=A0A9N9KT84_9HELO|nr:hypothetical protein HYFRA_00014231 [Hymenoscyphus fraxineus]CAG8951147.1 hypothetical protein HYFRA_00007892 [Hymenoscyphus fraxineus]CAG8960382.1 hypothetical protein HYFRA_00012457 [Hymenoscyphus fraxineus]